MNSRIDARTEPAWAPRWRWRHLPPVWKEGRYFAELRALRRSAVFAGRGLPPGRGRDVLLVPGFLANDHSLLWLADWLRRGGYRVVPSGLRLNADCGQAIWTSLERRLAERCEQSGRRALVVGHSRGGGFARILGVRRPDLVSHVITLGTPWRAPLHLHPLLLASVSVVSALGSAGVPRLFSRSCLTGDCCARLREDLRSALAPGVAALSIYSKSDGLVDWRACFEGLPTADCTSAAVDASHVGMTASEAVYEVIARWLERSGFA